MNRFASTFLNRFVWTALFLFASIGSKSQADEYGIKSMFLYKFIKYVEWPPETEKSVFRIGIADNSEMYNALLAVSKQKQMFDHPIEIVRLSPGDNTYCQMIFLGHEGHQKLDELAKRWAGKGVLIVTEDQRDSRHGASINLITMDHKVRFEINQSSARQAAVKISSELISMASTVNP